MIRHSDGFPAKTLVAALVLACGLAFGASASAATPGSDKPGAAVKSAPAPTAADAQAAGYVGDETCITCHEAEGKGFEGTLHGKSQNMRTPAGTGRSCETCHGPGKVHVDTGDKTKIRRFTAISSREANATCLSCHSKGSHAEWQGSMHDARNLACTTCHSIHNPKSAEAQLKTVSASETCIGCHKTEAMKVQRSGHMPVREGKMECTSCHDPHGSTNVRMLKTGNSVNEACTSCHAEKRGPFLWEHAAVRENCTTCHDPHGSNNDRMLVAKVPMLCQRCHVGTGHPPTIYDATQVAAGSNRVIGRGCVNCHSQIHGSNSPAGNTFLR
jgi:DmsE family decaheme c-type cytochrome